MNVEFNCSECRQLLAIDSKFGGTQVECPNCKTKIEVPSLQAPAEPVSLQEKPKRKLLAGLNDLLHRRLSPVELFVLTVVLASRFFFDIDGFVFWFVCGFGGMLIWISRGQWLQMHLKNLTKRKKRSSPWVIRVLVAIAAALFFGNFHIITGGSFGPRIVNRESFGFNEVFIDVNAITSMPWISAKSRFPLGCRVLAREGIIESDEAFQERIKRDVQEETERLLRDIF